MCYSYPFCLFRKEIIKRKKNSSTVRSTRRQLDASVSDSVQINKKKKSLTLLRPRRQFVSGRAKKVWPIQTSIKGNWSALSYLFLSYHIYSEALKNYSKQKSIRAKAQPISPLSPPPTRIHFSCTGGKNMFMISEICISADTGTTASFLNEVT